MKRHRAGEEYKRSLAAKHRTRAGLCRSSSPKAFPTVINLFYVGGRAWYVSKPDSSICAWARGGKNGRLRRHSVKRAGRIARKPAACPRGVKEGGRSACAAGNLALFFKLDEMASAPGFLLACCGFSCHSLLASRRPKSAIARSVVPCIITSGRRPASARPMPSAFFNVGDDGGNQARSTTHRRNLAPMRRDGNLSHLSCAKCIALWATRRRVIMKPISRSVAEIGTSCCHFFLAALKIVVALAGRGGK